MLENVLPSFWLLLMNRYVSILWFVRVTNSLYFLATKLQIVIISPLFSPCGIFNCFTNIVAHKNRRFGLNMTAIRMLSGLK
jgi:hypothetical protein